MNDMEALKVLSRNRLAKRITQLQERAERAEVKLKDQERIFEMRRKAITKAIVDERRNFECYIAELKTEIGKCERCKELKVELEKMKRDIHVYRGALGYAVPGDHDGELSDGTTPVCGLCKARQREKGIVSPLSDFYLSGWQRETHYETNHDPKGLHLSTNFQQIVFYGLNHIIFMLASIMRRDEKKETPAPVEPENKNLQIAFALLEKAGEFLDNWCSLRKGDAPHLMNSVHDDSAGWIHGCRLFLCIAREECPRCGGHKLRDEKCEKCGHNPKYYNLERSLSYGKVKK